MRYAYEVIDVPGKELTTADALSRYPVSHAETNELEREIEGHVGQLLSTLRVSPLSLEELKQEQQRDELCRQIRAFTQKGWPSRRDLQPSFKESWPHKDRITAVDDLRMHGFGIVVPKKLQALALRVQHEGHLGIDKCRAEHELLSGGL